jgi:hypothetical protein
MALPDQQAPRNARHFMIWIMLGVLAGLAVFLLRMTIDNEEIGNNVVPDVLIGAAIGAVIGFLRRPQRG